MALTRKEVYEIIDGEREYQETRWVRPQHNHSATEYLVYIDHYLKKALARVSIEEGEDGALENLRKIAALAVAAMEEHGAPRRMGYYTTSEAAYINVSTSLDNP